MANEQASAGHKLSTASADMVERVARALATADGKDPDAPAWLVYPGGTPVGICWQDQYAEKARAVIKAIREPTDAMERAGNQALTDNGLDNVEMGDATAGWKAMIDAALSTGEVTK